MLFPVSVALTAREEGQIITLFIIHFFPFYIIFLSLKSKYVPRDPQTPQHHFFTSRQSLLSIHIFPAAQQPKLSLLLFLLWLHYSKRTSTSLSLFSSIRTLPTSLQLTMPNFLMSFSTNSAKAASFLRFLDYTQTHTTDKTPLNEWSARRRGRYLYNTLQIQEQISMPSAGFEPAFKGQQNYV